MWYVTNQKHGVSALGLQRILGLGNWAWLHCCGAVEVDAWAAGKPASWGDSAKSIVAIAAEVRGRGTGRIRAMWLRGA